MAKTSTLLGVSIALVVVVAVYFLITGGGPSDTTQPSQDIRFITIKLTETMNEAKEWVPSTIYLKKGDTVDLTVINGDDDDIHRLAIPDLGVETPDIPPANQQIKTTFKVDKTGTFEFTDPLAPEWGSETCQAEAAGKPQGEEEEFLCVPPGQFIVEE